MNIPGKKRSLSWTLNTTGQLLNCPGESCTVGTTDYFYLWEVRGSYTYRRVPIGYRWHCVCRLCVCAVSCDLHVSYAWPWLICLFTLQQLYRSTIKINRVNRQSSLRHWVKGHALNLVTSEYFEYRSPICLFAVQLFWRLMAAYMWACPMLRDFRAKIFQVPSKSGPEMAVLGKGGLSVKFWFRDPEKVAYILARNRVFWRRPILRQNRCECERYEEPQRKKNEK